MNNAVDRSDDFKWLFRALALTDGPWMRFYEGWDRITEDERRILRQEVRNRNMILVNDLPIPDQVYYR